MKLNDIVYMEENEDYLVLQLRDVTSLIKLSKIEFEIISRYSSSLNKLEVIQFFADRILITEPQLDALVDLAQQLKLLVDPATLSSTPLVQLKGKRKKAIWEVLTLDFTHRRLERFGEQKKVQDIVLVTFMCLATVILFFLVARPFSFSEHYKRTLYLVPYSFSSLLVFIYLGAFLSMVIHELGHYFFYKRYQGKGSVFGVGLLLFVIPVFYNKLVIQQVKVRKHRLLIYAGGFIFDMLVVLVVLGSVRCLKDHLPVLVFIGYSMLISIFIRSLFNLNVFLPQTDGYYVLSDWLNQEQLFRVSSLAFCKLFKGNITLKQLLYSGFFLLSCASIAGAWFCFATPLLLFFYYVFSL
ncbi:MULTISPECIES: hypothetical protein [unclassified Myroides]|uniref:hypothetical protein n=1 Tax=unclassified Myroides TaxID=2642485 RepID=UPI003D2F8E10